MTIKFQSVASCLPASLSKDLRKASCNHLLLPTTQTGTTYSKTKQMAVAKHKTLNRAEQQSLTVKLLLAQAPV